MKNTAIKPLILPEYGRNVQNMVDYCLTIKDKAERQKCAEAIIQTMDAFSKTEKGREDYWQVLWDHLYIMSDFKLDVDFPYEVTTEEEYKQRPARELSNDHQKKPLYRHYGRNIECMIKAVVALPEGEERTELAKLTALQMKRNYVTWNKDTVANAKIFTDLYELSKGEIYLDEGNCQLPDGEELTGQANQTQRNNTGNKNRKKMNVNRRRGRQRKRR